MAIRDIFKISRKTFFDPRSWMGVDLIKQHHQTLWRSIRRLFNPPKPHREETFDEAMKRLHLEPQDIKIMIKKYRFFAIFFLSLAFLCFLYAFYLLIKFYTVTGFLLALATTALFLGQSFRYDFWGYQLKHRRLGVSFSQWKNSWFK